MNESDKVLLRRYHENGDLQAREQLIEQYMSLVRSLARRYSYRGEQLEDLVQIGCDRVDQGDRPIRSRSWSRAHHVRDAEHHRRDQAPFPRQGLGCARAAGTSGAERPVVQDRRAAHRAARALADDHRARKGCRRRGGRGARGARSPAGPIRRSHSRPAAAARTTARISTRSSRSAPRSTSTTSPRTAPCSRPASACSTSGSA